MYSYEDRLRAVRLYIKLGRRIGLAIFQHGYPTKNALLDWYLEYEQSHDLPAGYSRLKPSNLPSSLCACDRRVRSRWLTIWACLEDRCMSGKSVARQRRIRTHETPGSLTRIADAKPVRSMSRKGCSPDNAACEGFFGRLKIEMFFSRDWVSTNIEEFVAALDAYIRWHNDARIKSSLGFRSPAAHRRSLRIAA